MVRIVLSRHDHAPPNAIFLQYRDLPRRPRRFVSIRLARAKFASGATGRRRGSRRLAGIPARTAERSVSPPSSAIPGCCSRLRQRLLPAADRGRWPRADMPAIAPRSAVFPVRRLRRGLSGRPSPHARRRSRPEPQPALRMPGLWPLRGRLSGWRVGRTGPDGLDGRTRRVAGSARIPGFRGRPARQTPPARRGASRPPHRRCRLCVDAARPYAAHDAVPSWRAPGRLGVGGGFHRSRNLDRSRQSSTPKRPGPATRAGAARPSNNLPG